MTDQEYILKDRLREVIAGRAVRAALFYTFNFDPKFFENYVMPLLVPQYTFINNSIANNILWRKLYKDNLVPPITVYFDQDAKSTENGPYLDYYLVPVRMKMVGKNKGNFHPKQSFIVVENDDRSTELIVITGSNNLTQGGWCENIECISENTLISGREFPYEFRNAIRDFVVNVRDTFLRGKSDADDEVLTYLNKIGFTTERRIYFYDSFNKPFQEFLDEHVLNDSSITELEIISPFFHSQPVLLNTCLANKIDIKIQMPYRNGYCLLDKKVFEKYRAAGISWCYPKDETRNTHSKVYRFYGNEFVYTIVGSVNLTDPAWRGYESRSKSICNIESAVLYVEKDDKHAHLLGRKVKGETINYLPESHNEENWNERVEIPDISITIDWVEKRLDWISKATNDCTLHLGAATNVVLNTKGSLLLGGLKGGESILEGISRKPILRVTEKVKGGERTHYYYIHQIGFESRPLQFRLSASDIIDAWDLLGSEDANLNDWLISRLETVTEQFQDESGKLLSDKSANKSLLNEMARHFYGLAKLEQFLVDESILGKSNRTQNAHFNNLRYYLTCDNVDTLFSYLKDLQKLHESRSIMSVYYWLLLNIIRSNFYENPKLGKLLRRMYSESGELSDVKKSIASTSLELDKLIKDVQGALDVEKRKIKWALSILQMDYEAAQ